LAAAIFGLGTLVTAPTWAASSPTIGGFAVSAELHTRTKAASLTALVHRTSPTFTWGGSDMLWVQKDVSGKPQFAMNHAYPIDSDRGAATWALFEAPSKYESQGFVDYTRTITGGELISTSPHGARLYQVKWPSRQVTGTGPVATTRNLFVLHDEAGWRFVGEGPTTFDARSENKLVTTTCSFHVDWMTDRSKPVKISTTRQTTIELLKPDASQHFVWNRDFVLSGKLPAKFESSGKDYATISSRESGAQMIQRLAMCDTYYPNESDPTRKSKMLKAAAMAIAELNPHLPSTLRAGTKVLLPEMENLWDYALRVAKNKPMHDE
jgi:hypothetical protein